MQMIHYIDIRRSESLVRYVPTHSLVIVFVKSVIAKESSCNKERSRRSHKNDSCKCQNKRLRRTIWSTSKTSVSCCIYSRKERIEKDNPLVAMAIHRTCCHLSSYRGFGFRFHKMWGRQIQQHITDGFRHGN
jgi:hypothetical protein